MKAVAVVVRRDGLCLAVPAVARRAPLLGAG